MFDVHAPHLANMTVFTAVVPDECAFEWDAAALALMDQVLANNPDLEANDTNLDQAKSALLQMLTNEYLGSFLSEDFICDGCSEVLNEDFDEEPPF